MAIQTCKATLTYKGPARSRAIAAVTPAVHQRGNKKGPPLPRPRGGLARANPLTQGSEPDGGASCLVEAAQGARRPHSGPGKASEIAVFRQRISNVRPGNGVNTTQEAR